MNKTTTVLLAGLAALLLFGCGGTPPEVASQAPQRPEWTSIEPETEGSSMVFIGISDPTASERLARQAAMRNAAQNVVQYLGTAAQSKFEQASTSFGLSSQVVDPTQATRSFQQQLSANVARRLKASRWYMERETDSTGARGYKIFVKALIPLTEINAAFQRTAQDNAADAQKKARQAVTDRAKKQANDAADFWNKMSKQGLIPSS